MKHKIIALCLGIILALGLAGCGNTDRCAGTGTGITG